MVSVYPCHLHLSDCLLIPTQTSLSHLPPPSILPGLSRGASSRTTNNQINHPAIVPVQEMLRWKEAQRLNVLNVLHPNVHETAQRSRKSLREEGHPKNTPTRA